MWVAVLAGSLLRCPFRDLRREGLVECNICFRGLGSEESCTGCEVRVQCVEKRSLSIGAGFQPVRSGEPLVDLRELGVRVGEIVEGSHSSAEGRCKPKGTS